MLPCMSPNSLKASPSPNSWISLAIITQAVPEEFGSAMPISPFQAGFPRSFQDVGIGAPASANTLGLKAKAIGLA